MKKRCIMIFPEFENMDILNNIRDKYDPLAKHVRPHITLVFPFISDISTETLRKHLLVSLSEIKQFDIVLHGFQRSGEYLFLEIEKGANDIINIHNALYKGVLKEFYSDFLRRWGYHPHITVGRSKDESLMLKALEEVKKTEDYFITKVTKIDVEVIDDNEDSTIEITVNLNI